MRLQKNVGLHTARAVICFLPSAQGCRGDWDSGVPETSLLLFLFFFFENVRKWMN